MYEVCFDPSFFLVLITAILRPPFQGRLNDTGKAICKISEFASSSRK